MKTAVLALCALGCLPTAAEAELASYYGAEFAGRRTASGERFNLQRHDRRPPDAPLRNAGSSYEHPQWPVGGGSDDDRDPFVKGLSIDLSSGAARAIGMGGTAHVRLEVIR